MATRVNLADSKPAVSECLIAILSLIDDDVMAKSLNLDVLMHSRSEEARVRLFSVSCAEQLWRAHGDKLLGLCLSPHSSVRRDGLTLVFRLRGGDSNIHC